jgi:hypothetical protein
MLPPNYISPTNNYWIQLLPDTMTTWGAQRMTVSQFMTKSLYLRFSQWTVLSSAMWHHEWCPIPECCTLWLKGYPWKIFCRKFTLFQTQHTHRTEVSNKPNKYSHPTKLDTQNYKLKKMSQQECYKNKPYLARWCTAVTATIYKIITFDNLPKLVSWLLLCSPEGPGNNPGISTREIMNYNTPHPRMNILLHWDIYFKLQIHLQTNYKITEFITVPYKRMLISDEATLYLRPPKICQC